MPIDVRALEYEALKESERKATSRRHGDDDVIQTRQDVYAAAAEKTEKVSSANRHEYVYAKMRDRLFDHMYEQLVEVRRGLFDVVPEELLSVFDHNEFKMLLNGHKVHAEVKTASV